MERQGSQFLKKIEQRWNGCTIRQKITFYMVTVFLSITLSILFNVWVANFSLGDFNNILSESSQSSTLVQVFENETKLFEQFIKSRTTENQQLLDLAMQETHGAENSWPSYESTGHFEVAKYYTVDEHSRIPELQVCSKHTWEKLSEEDQQIILECAKESAIYQRQLWNEREQQSQKIAVDGGVEVIYLSRYERQKFEQAVVPLYELYCKEHMDLIEQIQQMN